MTMVKICGLREATHVQAAGQAGADLIGFVFAPSKRRVTPEQAAALECGMRNAECGIETGDGAAAPAASALTAAALPANPAASVVIPHSAFRIPHSVGLFVNEDPATMRAIIAHCRLDAVQLCGDEAPDAHLLVRLGCPVIRVLRPTEADSATVAAMATAWQAAAATADRQVGPVRGPWGSRLLIGLDAAHGGAYGGTGQRTDWTLAAQLAGTMPLMLAGGLTPANVAAAIAAVHPWAVDVSSGVETAGAKDPALIAAFVAAARGQSSVVSRQSSVRRLIRTERQTVDHE